MSGLSSTEDHRQRIFAGVIPGRVAGETAGAEVIGAGACRGIGQFRIVYPVCGIDIVVLGKEISAGIVQLEDGVFGLVPLGAAAGEVDLVGFPPLQSLSRSSPRPNFSLRLPLNVSPTAMVYEVALLAGASRDVSITVAITVTPGGVEIVYIVSDSSNNVWICQYIVVFVPVMELCRPINEC